MKRFLCIAALSALVLIPDWASACWPRRGGMAYRRSHYAPMYCAPVAYHPAPPIYYAAPPVYCEPVYGPPIYTQPHVPMTRHLPPPRIQAVTPKGESTLPASPPVARPEPAPAQPDSVRPAKGEVVPAPYIKPDPKPEQIPPTVVPVPEPRPEPAPDKPKRGGLFEIPQNPVAEPKPVDKPKVDEPKPPEVKPKAEEPKLPPIELPKVNSSEPKLPSIELPKESDPKLPSLELPGGAAVPVPAPSSDVLTPPSGAATPKNDGLPPLALPPDTPVAPVPSPKLTEAKSSPLATAARELKVTVFPAAGAATAAGLRKVGFFNHTSRDLALAIEGKPVTLPAMSYLHANLPPTFAWKCADRPAAKETVPADATGLDVLIRE